MIVKQVCLALLGACGVALSGCTPASQDELQAWVRAERSAVKFRSKPLPEPAAYQAQAYEVAGLLEPFSNEKLSNVSRDAPGLPKRLSTQLASEAKRSEQPLQAYPLDSMTMVGTMSSQGQKVALVRVNKLLHPVQVGSYLGQNQGRVVQITDRAILLRETLRNDSGQRTERPATLEIEEDAPQ